MKSVIQPPALQSGDTIGIVSPAGPPEPNALDQGVQFLVSNGFIVKTGQHTLKRSGYLAGTDTLRASDINTMIRDPRIKAIFCTKGGYGSARILQSIDYTHLRENPKIIVGFSDMTSLLQAIYLETGILTFHGPLIAATDNEPWNMSIMIRHLKGKSSEKWISPPGCQSIRFLSETPFPTGISGVVLGGCLTLVTSLIGTPWGKPDRPFILFLEEIGEAPYRIDRMVTQITNSGFLDHCVAVVLGQFIRCVQRADDPEPTPTTEAVLLERFTRARLPVFKWKAFGHGKYNHIMPIGCPISITSEGIIQNLSSVRL